MSWEQAMLSGAVLEAIERRDAFVQVVAQVKVWVEPVQVPKATGSCRSRNGRRMPLLAPWDIP